MELTALDNEKKMNTQHLSGRRKEGAYSTGQEKKGWGDKYICNGEGH